jgi:hypothetical protein
MAIIPCTCSVGQPLPGVSARLAPAHADSGASSGSDGSDGGPEEGRFWPGAADEPPTPRLSASPCVWGFGYRQLRPCARPVTCCGSRRCIQSLECKGRCRRQQPCCGWFRMFLLPLHCCIPTFRSLSDYTMSNWRFRDCRRGGAPGAGPQPVSGVLAAPRCNRRGLHARRLVPHRWGCSRVHSLGFRHPPWTALSWCVALA